MRDWLVVALFISAVFVFIVWAVSFSLLISEAVG